MVSSRTPWRADLVDTITLSGPLPQGWEAELWHEERLVAVTREADAAGQWVFGDVPLRIGENRWTVRLYGPNGESQEQVFTRLVGTEMNAENEVGYAFGIVDGGRPLIGTTLAGEPAGPAAFASIDRGFAPEATARIDVRAEAQGRPAVALGFNGALGGGLWAVTGARDRAGGLGGAIPLARRFGAQDLTFDLARHGRDNGPGLPAQVREFAQVASIAGQGRIDLGRLSLPWQARYQTGSLRRGGSREVAAARLTLPMADWQAILALGALRDGEAPWTGSAAFDLTARHGEWRLRSGISASDSTGMWRIDSASLSAARRLGAGGEVLIGGIAPGPQVEIETQMSSLADFTLRPARPGDSLTLRPGEVRHVAMPLRPTASIEVQVLLVANDERTARSGVPVILRDAEGRETARARSDFDGFVLFEGLAFGAYRAAAAGQVSGELAVSREAPEARGRELIAAGG